MYLKIILTYSPDSSDTLGNVLDHEKIQVFVSSKVNISNNHIEFYSAGASYSFDLSNWEIQINPYV